MWKNESKIECRKIIEEIAPTGTQNESKTDKKWRGKPCKSRKIAKKRCFWKGGFLMIFWVAKKSKKGGITIIEGWVLLAPGLQWGTIGGTIQKSFWLSNTPLGRWPGELLLYLNFPKSKIQKSDNFSKYKISKKILLLQQHQQQEVIPPFYIIIFTIS